MLIRLYQLANTDKKIVGRMVGSLPYYVLEGELRDSMDIMNPQLIIDISETSNISAVSIPEDEEEQAVMIRRFRNNPLNTVNYVYIPYLRRYYWITNIVLLRKNIIQFALHVDVLQFSEFIESQIAFVARNEYDYNSELPDERRIVTNQIEIETINIVDLPNRQYIKFNPYFDNSDKKDVYNIVATGLTSGVGVAYISDSDNEITSAGENLPTVIANNFIPINSKVYLLNRRMLARMLYYVSWLTPPSGENVASFIGSIYAYPFDFKRELGDRWWNAQYNLTTFSLGTTDISENGENARNLRSLTSGYMVNTAFVLGDYVTDFNDLEPYSSYELYIPYYGYYTINYNALRGHTLILYYVVNYQTGTATVILYDDTNESVITSLQAQLGIEIPKNVSNIKDVVERHNANNMSLGFGLVASALSVIVGIATENPVAVAGGAIGTGKTIGSYVTNEKTNILNEQIQLNGSTAPIFAPQNAFIRKKKKKIQYNLTSEFLQNNGGILNQLRRLSTLNGYTEIADIPVISYEEHMSNIPTDNEVDEIIALLKSGVVFHY